MGPACSWPKGLGLASQDVVSREGHGHGWRHWGKVTAVLGGRVTAMAVPGGSKLHAEQTQEADAWFSADVAPVPFPLLI